MNVPVFETFGCRLNAYETEAMKGLAEAAGLGDVVVVNSCAVTGEAVRQARQRIRRLRQANPGARVIVTGCAAQTEPETFAAMPEVDLVLGNAEKLRPAAWAQLADGSAGRVAVGDIMAERRTPAPLVDGLGTRSRAYVQVQTGCDHRVAPADDVGHVDLHHGVGVGDGLLDLRHLGRDAPGASG